MERNNENAYERFRRRQQVLKSCNVKKTGMFIENSEISTEVTVDRTGDVIPVAMAMSFKEGADELFVFSYNDADFHDGDYFTWIDHQESEHHFFTSEQLIIIKDVRYKKFKAYECNVLVNGSWWAYFKSSMRAAKDSGFSLHIEGDKQLPIMIAPKNDDLQMNKYITIEGQEWRIVEADTYTVDAIGFYTLDRVSNKPTEIKRESPLYFNETLYVGQEITLSTKGGEYSLSGCAELIRRTSDSITFKVLKPKDEEDGIQVETPTEGWIFYNVKENI